ncbi:hypothetical protein SY27_10840 [Flavobacterium sp. 316]|uniref:DUF6265 family protein n=1 Tax=Flavobacterium sp. 316 TaxID=1603293 RepID=UPI0005DDC4A6|nr:DUF6265 family protein [Flavobacterium sp. 316]KIX21239.1 hypothetical protein SY27_10840 [Flavobacterium sp. 316]
MKKVIFLLLLVISFGYTQNTLHYNDEKGSEKATLKDIEWLEGNWTGDAFGGIFQENWNKPLGGSMLFNFKLVVDGKVAFYEIGHIIEKDKTLLYQIKHFDADLKGWEEKDKSEDFRFIKKENNRMYFDNFTFEKVSDNEVNLYAYFEDSKEEVVFNFKK